MPEKKNNCVIEGFKDKPGEHTQFALNAVKNGVFKNIILEHKQRYYQYRPNN